MKYWNYKNSPVLKYLHIFRLLFHQRAERNLLHRDSPICLKYMLNFSIFCPVNLPVTCSQSRWITGAITCALRPKMWLAICWGEIFSWPRETSLKIVSAYVLWRRWTTIESNRSWSENLYATFLLKGLILIFENLIFLIWYS